MSPTYDSDVLPSSSGQNLGAPDARWDASIGNLDVSGVITGNFAALAIFKLVPVVVPWSATPNFDGSTKATGFKMILLGDVTAPTFNNIGAGQLVSVVLIQDGTGGHAFAWPGNVKGGMAIGAAPNETSAQLFWYDGTTLISLTPGNIA